MAGHAEANLARDPLTHAARAGLIPPLESLTDDPASFQGRLLADEEVAADNGVPAIPFTTDEVSDFALAFRDAGYRERHPYTFPLARGANGGKGERKACPYPGKMASPQF